MQKVKIEPARLKLELKAAREAFERSPDTWRGNETLGRVLHWTNDPTSREYLQKAIEFRLNVMSKNRIQGWEYIAIGNYYRMAGDLENAREFFLKAYDLSKTDCGNISEKIKLNPMTDLCIACFLLGKYEEAVTYGKLLHEEYPNPRFLPWNLSLRAEAVLANDIDQLRAMVNNDAKSIYERAGRGSFSETSFITGLDIYMISLEILNKMEAASCE